MTRSWFHRRRVVITGGSSGLGLALAHALQERGADLLLVGRDADRLQAAAERVRQGAGGPPPRTSALDVTDPAAVARALVDEPVDVLINNAGILREGRFDELTDAALRETMETNFFGAVNVIRSALPQLRARRGRIVNVASAAGLTGVFGYTAYCAAKHALVGFSEALGFELRPDGVLVQVVCPGEFDSPMVAALERSRSAENRAHTLTIPKTPLATVVQDTLRGIVRGVPVIVPGGRTRTALAVRRVAPGLTRGVGDRRIAAAARHEGARS